MPYIIEPGVDDYLHQAADPKYWPAGIVYAPNGDNIPMKGLGVHEHWNNPMDKQYSRNLGKGEGIDLVLQNLNNYSLKALFIDPNFIILPSEKTRKYIS